MRSIKTLFLLLFFGALFLSSCMDQAGTRITQFESSVPQKIDSGFEVFKPVFHPNKNAVLFTDSKDEGLFIQDPITKKTNQLSKEKLSGFELHFDEEGKNLAFVTHHFSNKKRMSSLIIHNTVTQAQNRIVQDKRQLKIIGIQNEVIYFLKNGELGAYDLNRQELTSDRNITAVILHRDLTLSVFDNGVQKTLIPGGPGNYLWPSISPDRRSILYSLSGKETYISDLEGNNTVSLGRLHAPKWSPDGKWVLGMDDYDDGHRFTKSDIIVVSRDGKERMNLTERFEGIALYPSFSPDSREVVFNDESGTLYKMKVR